MRVDLSVVIPAHNPRMDYFDAVLEALRGQSLPFTRWELVVIDNRSAELLAERLSLNWHPNHIVFREEALGLTRARIAGFQRANGGLIVLVDDDNVLAPDYLERALEIAETFPFLGAWSGHQEPVYEKKGFDLPASLEHLVGGRRCVEAIWSNDVNHHSSTPWGAGLCIRRQVMLAYLKRLEDDPRRRELDLIGGKRIYGGDTDIAFTGCQIGLGKGVFPQLKLRHLISEQRCSESYLVKVTEGHAYSAALHEYLDSGKITPPRSDYRGRLMAGIRWIFSTSIQRQMQRAYREGYQKAISELIK